jgi:iron complex outermembrane receptor protein
MEIKPARIGAFVALFTFGALLHAQTVAPEATPTNTPEGQANEEVLTLDEFVVTASATTGYRATNSITATGIGAPIGDTPIFISVVTKDLIKDTRSDLITDTLRFVPGVVTAPTNESQPSVRGFQGTYSLRNGVFRRQNLTTWNVDRVEVIQGASSIFYSNIRPGGVINYITTKPVLGKNFADVSFTGGSYEYLRGEAAFNVAVGDRLAFRVDLGSMATHGFRKNYYETQSFFSVSALWSITPNQQLTLEAGGEQTWRRNSWTEYATPPTNSRYWKNPAAIASGQTLAAFMAANFPGQPRYDEFAPFAPGPGDPFGRVTNVLKNTYQHGSDKPIDATYTAKIADQLFLSVIGNSAFEDNEGINPVWSGDIFADGTFRSFGAQRFVNVRYSTNLNTKLTYRADAFHAKHTIIVGNDNQWVTQHFPQVNGSANQNSPTFTFNPQIMGAADGRALVAASPVPFNSARKTLQYFEGYYFVDQMALLNDRLFVVWGDRYVKFKQHVTYHNTYQGSTGAVLPAPPPDAIAKKWTPQLGALYKVGGAALFGSYSESVIPQTQIDASGQTVLPINGKGYDLGIKLDALKGALTGTIDYYSIKQTNTALSDNVQNAAHGLPNNATFGYYTYGNAQQVRGVQFDLSYNISQEFQLMAGMNHFIQAENVAPQSAANMIGVPIAYQPKNMCTVWTRYQASKGSLKGLILGGGFHYKSRGTVGGTFDQSQFFVPAFTIFDVLVGYDAKVFDHAVEFRLNGKNIFNKIYRDGAGGAFNNPRTVFLSASTRF